MGDIWNLSTLCRCCHADGRFKNLREKSSIAESLETYEMMLRDVFGIFIDMPRIAASYSICDNCIKKLHDGFNFKNQVTACEEKFQVYCKNEQFLESIVKEEICISDNEHWDDDTVPLRSLVKKEVKVEVDIIKEISIKNEDKPKANYIDNVDPDTREKGINTKIKKEYRKKKLKKIGKIDKSQSIMNGKTRLKSGIKRPIKRVMQPKYRCKYCEATFSDRKTYFQHIYDHGKEPSDFQCPHCQKNLSSKYALRDHLHSHIRIKRYVCHLCDKAYAYKSSLNNHIRWHQGTKRKVLCDLCGRGFNDKTNLDIHIEGVHLKIRAFTCDICKKRFAGKRTLRSHILVRHMGAEIPGRANSGTENLIFTCQTCEKRFRCPKSFKAHVLRHENKYVCRVCSKVFDDKDVFNEHVATHVPSLTCSLCAKTFMSRFTFNRHMNVHNGIRKFACEFCDAKCVDKAQLKRHVFRWHNPNRPPKVQCQICKRYVLDIEKHLEGHKHKNLACEYCGKRYVGTSALNRHMGVAHFGKEFRCDVCNKNYVSLRSMLRHKMKVHKLLKVENQRDPDCREVVNAV